MSKVLDGIKQRAVKLNKHIVLPEGEDKRVVEAAAVSVKEGVAKITLLGDPDEIRKNKSKFSTAEWLRSAINADNSR